MQSGINFKHLEVFYSLAKSLSFTQCSKDLNKAQPAISKQIQILEREMGTQLFIRSKKGVELTTQGKKLYSLSHNLYEEICSRVNAFKSDSQIVSGEVTFGCLGEIGERIFIFAINDFIKKNPNIKVNIKYLKTQEIVSGIKNGSIDIGIVAQNILQEQIRTYSIYDEEIVLTCSPKNKIKKVKSLKDLPILKYRKDDPLLNYYQQKVFPRANKSNVDTFMEVNSHKSMVEILKRNNCMAVLPELSIKNELKKGQLIDIGPKKLKSHLYLMHLDLEYMDKKVSLLSSFLRDHINNL
jgi:DNA-binding transcriptional LysR family regulator